MKRPKKLKNSEKKKWDTQLEAVNPDYDAAISQTGQDKLKEFAEQLKSVFATKIELKERDIEREIENFFILDIQDYSPTGLLMFMKNSLVLMKLIKSSTV